jgi:REP element-mobilizing transposase RayT
MGIKQGRINYIMGSYTQIIYHIVFGTKYRVPALHQNYQRELYQYIWGILRNKKCTLYKIGGVEDHVHVLSSLHPNLALADFVKDIKRNSTRTIKENWFPSFQGWQVGYAAFTQNLSDKKRLADYIANQKDHHQKSSFKQEYITLLEQHKIEFEEKYLFEKEFT